MGDDNDATTDTAGRETADWDEINLDRALNDFEVASARVIDLSSRVVELNSQLLLTRSRLDEEWTLRVRAEERCRALEEELARINSRIAYRVLKFGGEFLGRGPR